MEKSSAGFQAVAGLGQKFALFGSLYIFNNFTIVADVTASI